MLFNLYSSADDMYLMRLVLIAFLNVFTVNGFSTISRLVKAVRTESEDSIFQDGSGSAMSLPTRPAGLVPYKPMATAGFFLGDYIKQFLTTTVAPRANQAHPYREYCRLKDTQRRYNIFCRYKDYPSDDAVDFCNFYQVACVIYKGSSGGDGGSMGASDDDDDDSDSDQNGDGNGNGSGKKKKYPIDMSDVFKKAQTKPVPVQFGIALQVD